MCPHCATSFHESWSVMFLQQDSPPDGDSMLWSAAHLVCPECGQLVVELRTSPSWDPSQFRRKLLVHPAGPTRPVPPQVEARYAEDFRQAAATLPSSAKASAAVS